MKKIILASTALVLSAGIAAAEVKVSGDGWMGVKYNTGAVAPVEKASFVSRARVVFTLSGQTDTGLAFGGSFRADNAGNASAGTAGSVFISGTFGKLSMGDVDTALNATYFRTRHIGVLETHGGARTADQGHSAKPSMLYEYTMDGLKVALSVGQVGSKQVSVGVQYKMSGYGVGLGYYADSSAAGATVKTATALSFEGTFDSITARLAGIQMKRGNGNKSSEVGMDVRAKFDATEVQFNAKRATNTGAAAVTTVGLGATYDLGGGALLGGGVSKASNAKAVADFGLAFKF